MEIYVKYLRFQYFHFFLIFKHAFITYIDFTHIASSNTAMMTSQIKSNIEYLLQTYILALILKSKLMKNLASMTVINTI